MGAAVSCEEKIKVLNQNLEEIRQFCQDAFEDALLMGCDEEPDPQGLRRRRRVPDQPVQERLNRV